jgi:hypothetical protein
MRVILRIVGVLLVLFGCVWFLPSVDLFPRTFTDGPVGWILYGGSAVLLGVILLSVSKRRTLT